MIFMFVQAESLPAPEGINVGASSAAAAVCRLCGKAAEATEFSKSQKKRLKQGRTATCKGCSGANDPAAAKASATASEEKPKVGNNEVMQ